MTMAIGLEAKYAWHLFTVVSTPMYPLVTVHKCTEYRLVGHRSDETADDCGNDRSSYLLNI